MSASPPQKRRFLPEPVETTVKSSRRFAPDPMEIASESNDNPPDKEEMPTKSTRKFAPEPVETTTKSSRKFAPDPVETTTKSSRKFAPEPVETTQRSSRKFNVEPVETTKSTRRFAPEPVETTVTSSRDKPSRRFAPQPISTTTRSNRKGSADTDGGAAKTRADSSGSQESPQIDDATPRPRRKFAPQLIEIAARSRKSGDDGPCIREGDRTETTPESVRSPVRRGRLPPPVPFNTPAVSLERVPQLLEARRLGIPLNLKRSESVGSNRSHSFRVPELDTIESSESEEEGPPSLSTSPSITSDLSVSYKHATRRRESVDERFAGFMLQIAAEAAEKQMREQAMAAFPNDDHHEPVSHFIDDDGEAISDGSGEMNQERRESFTKVNWELLAMQKHQEEKKQQEKELKSPIAEPNKSAWGDPWGLSSPKSPWESEKNPPDPWGDPTATLFGNQRGRPEDRELTQMHRGARPPMLGGDIHFPRCRSPEPARFDVTQGSEAIRNSMCYLTQQSQSNEQEGGLWKGCNISRKTSHTKEQSKKRSREPELKLTKAPSLWSNPGSSPPSNGGLWRGSCKDTGLKAPNQQTGMLTPQIEIGNPFDSPPPTPAYAPPSPPPSNPDISTVHEKLTARQALEEEFSDGFVSQVFNYLSLGYPSLAHKYDEELSKISRIPVSELRQDDELAKPKGYVRLGSDRNIDVNEDTSARWRALRVYIFEWAKQQPNMVPADFALGGFGVAARRGSWAW
ncbi:uncharacterized protein K452DRAFT_282912 [Aplosporella prunicola CBS 121167]|uniref:Uncharacterized protein n=1 Tax=Aplosporella prunicola CBS 121167 TaxID=1176127 RepID=A0A6A6BTX8_9PEZI|nr:uncharacterized protein K452DRAFT_282912 [Aplosporella prunicola CBS 121167]KAF2146725.1 hypothetical protein K452DRAFT_282912 [Aplosporella prunicola CBS 121167]